MIRRVDAEFVVEDVGEEVGKGFGIGDYAGVLVDA
jgi:hypothetical protein